jgi:hypothetical protein
MSKIITFSGVFGDWIEECKNQLITIVTEVKVMRCAFKIA